MSEDEITYVYIIARNMDGYAVHPIKVGIAKDVSARLKTIQTATPFKIGLVHAFRLPDRHTAKGVEGGFHRVLRGRQSHGEWFDMHPEIAMAHMRLNLEAMHSSWPGMQDVEEIPLSHFLWLCCCPDRWVEDAKIEVSPVADSSHGAVIQ